MHTQIPIMLFYMDNITELEKTSEFDG